MYQNNLEENKMSLKIESSYVNKQGATIPLNIPKMKLMGKLMDEGETHEFIVLSKEGVKTWETNPVNVGGVMKVIPKHTLMVKFEGQEQGFSLDLSEQAKNSIERVKPQQFDKLTVVKGSYTNEKTGAVIPIVNASVEINARNVGVSPPNVPTPQAELQQQVLPIPKDEAVVVPVEEVQPEPVIIDTPSVENTSEGSSGVLTEYKFMLTFTMYPGGKMFPKIFPIGTTRKSSVGKKKQATQVGEVEIGEEMEY